MTWTWRRNWCSCEKIRDWKSPDVSKETERDIDAEICTKLYDEHFRTLQKESRCYGSTSKNIQIRNNVRENESTSDGLVIQYPIRLTPSTET